MAESYESLARKLRRKVYSSPEELAKDVSDGLASISRQPSIERGVNRDVIADVQGGVSLGVGDQAATHVSDYLVQNQQPGLPPDVGSGLKVRRQTRIRTTTRVLAAKVVTDASPGDEEVEVVIVGSEPVKTTDPVTGIEIVDNASGQLDQPVDDMIGKRMMVKMTGQPIVTDGSEGIQPILAGRTVSIALNEQFEDTSSWTKRGRKNIPVITSVKKCETGCLVNGLACVGTVCNPEGVDYHYFTQDSGNDWGYNNDGLDPNMEGRPWCVIELIQDGSIGTTIDRNNGDFAYYDYGVVGPGGTISFTGVLYSHVAGLNHFWEDNTGTVHAFNPPYFWVVMVGCAQGQSVNFGKAEPIANPGNGWPDTSFNVIDSNFPIPL